MKAIINASEKSRIANLVRDENFKNRMIFSVGPRPANWKKEGWVEIWRVWAFNQRNIVALNEILGKRGAVLEVAYETSCYSGAGFTRPARMFVRGGKVEDAKAWHKLQEYRESWKFSDYKEF